MTGIYLVGPSGAGKSELLKQAVPQVPGAQLLDLDERDRSEGTEEWGVDWEARRWARDVVRLAPVDTHASLILVDVGAGSLQTPLGRSYFRTRGSRCIAIVADPGVVFSRKHKAGGRDYTEFLSTEYGTERTAVYGGACVSIDTSAGEIEQDTMRLLRAIDQIRATADRE